MGMPSPPLVSLLLLFTTPYQEPGAPPETPVRTSGQGGLDSAALLEIAEDFAERFCARLDDAELPYSELQSYYDARVRSGLGERRFEVAMGSMRQPGEATFRLSSREGSRFLFRIEQTGPPWILDLALDAQGKIASLFVRPAPEPRSREELIETLDTFEGDWGLASLLLDERGRPLEYVELGASRPFAMGSSFKLWVLAELARQISAGERSFDERVAIRDAWKSLPSGTMQALPAGTERSLREMAQQMIAISDNTATDHLIHLLGRGRIEAHLEDYACTNPDDNRPLLTTRDLFLFKSLRIEQRARVFESGKLDDVARSFAAADEEQQAQWLEELEAVGAELSNEAFQKTALAYGIQTSFTPGHLAIEWFARPRDTVELLRRAFVGQLVDPRTSEHFLEVFGHGQPQCSSPGVERQGYKGGSETGVFHLAAGVEMKDGRVALACLARSGFGTLAAAKVPGESVALFQAWLAELVETERPPIAQRAVRIDVRVEPLVDLWFEVRAQAEDESTESEPLAEAVAAMRELGRELGSALAFGYVENLLENVKSAAELVEACAALPEEETVPGRGGARRVALREHASAVAKALSRLEADWLREAWPRRRNALEALRLRLMAQLSSPAGRAALEHLCDTLELRLEQVEIPIYLSLHAGWPGGVTHFSMNGGGVCFVSLEERSLSLMLETCLHEALHALDVLDDGNPNLLERLRSLLSASGIDERDPRQRSWTHTLFFVHAADTVRRFLDPDHVDYGIVEEYYARVGKIAEVELALWSDLHAQNLDKDELLEAIVEAARAR